MDLANFSKMELGVELLRKELKPMVQLMGFRRQEISLTRLAVLPRSTGLFVGNQCGGASTMPQQSECMH